MWRGQRVSVIFPTYNEKDSIADVVRAFDDGVGFRYEIPDQPALRDYEISDELTEFTLADNARTWWIASDRPRLDRSASDSRSATPTTAPWIPPSPRRSTRPVGGSATPDTR